MEFTHFNHQGRARMVDVSEKADTLRTATAKARVLLNADTYALVKSGGIKKGDVLTTAQIAGIMGAKRTPDVIPMCHPIARRKGHGRADKPPQRPLLLRLQQAEAYGGRLPQALPALCRGDTPKGTSRRCAEGADRICRIPQAGAPLRPFLF